ncbi:MAG TPA: type II toxin-antitoxin system prevent-host-death family antitoxin [Candidatus Tyrphobacter sp.]
MKQVNLYQAKTHLSLLVAEALKGEEVVLARNGTPLVRLVPVEKRKPSDAFGMDRGKVWIAPDFDETPEDFKDYM